MIGWFPEGYTPEGYIPANYFPFGPPSESIKPVYFKLRRFIVFENKSLRG